VGRECERMERMYDLMLDCSSSEAVSREESVGDVSSSLMSEPGVIGGIIFVVV